MSFCDISCCILKVYAIGLIWIEIQMQQVNGVLMYCIYRTRNTRFLAVGRNGIYEIIVHYQQSLTALKPVMLKPEKNLNIFPGELMNLYSILKKQALNIHYLFV